MTDFAGLFETVGAADFSMGWLKAVFGPALGEGEHTAISAAAATLNAALLIIGASAVAWHTLLGIVNTAHEGKVLGQQWHQIWAPVRVAVGIACLAPIPAYGGFGAAQLAVLQLAQWGVGLADTIWSASAARVAAGGDVVAAPTPNSKELMHSIIRMQTCRHAILAATPDDLRPGLAKAMHGGSVPYLPAEPLTSTEEIKSGLFGTGKVSTMRYQWELGTCGAVKVDVAVNPPAADGLVTVADKGKISAAQVGAIESMLAVADGVGAAIVAASLDAEQAFPTASVVDEAVREYDRTMQDAAKEAASATVKQARQRFAEKSAEGGWTTAGSWYMSLAAITGEYVRAASVMPDIRAPRLADKAGWHPGTGGVRAAEEALAVGEKWWTDRYTFRGVGTPEDVEIGGSDSIWSKLDFLSVAKLRGIYDAAALDPADPLGGMVRMGHYALGTAEALTLAGAVAWTAGGSIVGSAVGADGGLSFLLPLVWMILFGIYSIGIMHAYVLPMLPYIMHTLACFAWLIFACEAVIAAPLWALVHGDIGDAFGGYPLVFFLPPAVFVVAASLWAWARREPLPNQQETPR